jgi:putative flippase GtrA
VPIKTIYIEGNKSSHFRPVFDSMRIYFLLLRFSVLSILSALVDYLVFWLTWRQFGSIGRAQATARVVSVAFNYAGVRRVVFNSRQRHAVVMPRYFALAIVNGLLSYAGIKFLNLSLGLPPVIAKVAVELPLFIANFAIQRDFIFTRRKP